MQLLLRLEGVEQLLDEVERELRLALALLEARTRVVRLERDLVRVRHLLRVGGRLGLVARDRLLERLLVRHLLALLVLVLRVLVVRVRSRHSLEVLERQLKFACEPSSIEILYCMMLSK